MNRLVLALFIVIRVIDGDTFVVANGSTVRINAIDASEISQPYGMQAADYLKRNLVGNIVRVKVVNRDRWGRYVGDVYLNGIDVGEAMVLNGAAWDGSAFSRWGEDARLQEAQRNAMKWNLGLWQDLAPVPPWEFRRMRRK